MVPSFGRAPTTLPDAARIQSGRRALLVLFGILGLLTTTFL